MNSSATDQGFLIKDGSFRVLECQDFSLVGIKEPLQEKIELVSLTEESLKKIEDSSDDSETYSLSVVPLDTAFVFPKGCFPGRLMVKSKNQGKIPNFKLIFALTFDGLKETTEGDALKAELQKITEGLFIESSLLNTYGSIEIDIGTLVQNFFRGPFWELWASYGSKNKKTSDINIPSLERQGGSETRYGIPLELRARVAIESGTFPKGTVDFFLTYM